MTDVVIRDPLTGKNIVYSNPFRYDAATKSWIAEDITKVNGDHFNNLLRFGQPYNPNNYFDQRFYRSDLESVITEPTVRFDNSNVLLRGFGKKVSFDDFDLVKNLKAGKFNCDLQEGRVYTLKELQGLGISPSKLVGNIDYGQHAQGKSLYLWKLDDPGVASTYNGTDAAYIFGSVRFQISNDTTFRIQGGKLYVDGKIELQDDAFKHESGALSPWVSALVQAGMGDYAAFDKVLIVYDGQGASRRLVAEIPLKNKCFAAGTPILLADGGSCPIEEIRIGDVVMAFDPEDRSGRAPLRPREVVGLFQGLTRQWARIEFDDASSRAPLTVTPDHRVLTADGRFEEIAKLVDTDGSIELVRADGGLIRARVTFVDYQESNASAYEAAEKFVAASSRSLALSPMLETGWRTYNFEVAGLHTYVAGDVRVHNECTAIADLSEATMTTLKSLGLAPGDFQPYTDEFGNKIAIVRTDACITNADGSVSNLGDFVGMIEEGTQAVMNAVGKTLSKFPSYLNTFAMDIIGDLVMGGDLENVAERYAVKLAVTMGVDALAELFGLNPSQIGFVVRADGTTLPLLNGTPFLDSAAGQAIKGSIMQFAVVAALQGSQMKEGDWVKLAANTSMRAAVNYVVQTYGGSWAVNTVVTAYVEAGNGVHAVTGTNLTPAGAGAVAAAVAFFSNLIDHGFKDFGNTLVQTAIAGASAYIGAEVGAMIGSVIPGIGTIIGAVIGSVIGNWLGSLFGGRKLPPPPPLVQTETNADGTQTIYVTPNSGGYAIIARAGQADILVGGSHQDRLIGSDAANRLYGQAGDDLIFAGAGNDLVLGGTGADLIVGGEGRDVILGGDGNDLIYGDSQADHDEARNFRQNAAAEHIGEVGEGGSEGNAPSGDAAPPDEDTDEADFAYGDLIQGGAGNDRIFAGRGNDVVSGGYGSDVIFGQSGDDMIEGAANEDYLDGGEGDDYLDGGDDDDVVLGGSGDDVVIGGNGNDRIEGGDGGDLIYADRLETVTAADGTPAASSVGTGNDVVDAGAGDDAVYAAGGNDTIDGGTGSDQLFGEDGDDVLRGGDGNDNVDGGAGLDVLEGGAGDDRLYGGLGDDVLRGGLGADSLLGDLGNDRISGDEGDDIVLAGIGNDTIDGGAGADTLLGEIGDDVVSGGEGNDTISGGSQNDRLSGDAGNDEIHGGTGIDRLDGGIGDDLLSGDEDDDVLVAGAGNDTLDGGTGADRLDGGDGNDRLDAGDGNDTLDGGAGADSAYGGAGNDTIALGEGDNLAEGGLGDDVISAGSGADRITGGAGNDTIAAGDGANRVWAEDGNDVVTSGSGADRLDGGAGNDLLQAGAGNDTLDGGIGDDRLFGEDGDDQIWGRDGNDAIDTGTGADKVWAGIGNDTIVAGDGANQVWGEDATTSSPPARATTRSTAAPATTR